MSNDLSASIKKAYPPWIRLLPLIVWKGREKAACKLLVVEIGKPARKMKSQAARNQNLARGFIFFVERGIAVLAVAQHGTAD